LIADGGCLESAQRSVAPLGNPMADSGLDRSGEIGWVTRILDVTAIPAKALSGVGGGFQVLRWAIASVVVREVYVDG
jgi:hypothetical protein